MTNIIVSYDGTANDQDALVLGRLLHRAGAELSLAYVRHAVSRDREAAETEQAARLLEEGARTIGLPDAPRHVVINPSTPRGLAELVEREHADVVVFGSDYRTARGSLSRGTSAQSLLNGGSAAVAIAPAGLRDERQLEVTRVAVLAEDDDPAAQETAASLADALGATVVGVNDRPQLLVVGSRPEGVPGRVTLSASAEYAIETAAAAVLVLPRETRVRFPTPALAGV